MPSISRSQARNLVENRGDVVVIEVLDEDNYRKFHLPGAQNIPLDDAFDRRVQDLVPNRKTPVLVYCMDTECDASRRAAARLDQLGYSEIYDYEAGKVDWKEAGLPVEEHSTASA